MELKIYSPQDAGFVQKIDWNFDELKAEITAAAHDYETSVYTDESIKAAKADRAKLNKFVDALKKKRTEIRKKLLEPDELFGQQVTELVAIMEKAINNINTQVVDYENRQREAKKEKIREFYEENIHDLAEYLPFERVLKTEHILASTSMKSVKEDILALIQKVNEGLAILNEVDSPYAGDMKAAFLRSYDIGAAMAVRNRLETEAENRRLYAEEQARRKAEREAARRAEVDRINQAGNRVAAEPPKEEKRPEPTMETVEEPLHVIDFRVHATTVQLAQLKNFLKVAGIRYEPVPKN